MWIWRDGRLIEHSRRKNLIVGGSKFIHAQLIGGNVAGNSVTQVGFGSNATPPVLSDSSLSADAYIKPLDAVSYSAPNKVDFSYSLGSLEALGLSLAELGLFTAGNLLYARLVRAAPLIKDQSVSLAAIWTETY